MKKDVIWNSLGVSTWSFLSLFLLIIVTRVNGIANSGLFSFSFAFAMIIFTVSCFSGRTYQVSDHREKFSSSDYISFRIITSTIALLIAILFIVINQYDLLKSALLFLLVMHRVFDSFADVLYGIMQKQRHLHISGKSLFYKSIVSLAAFLIIDIGTTNVLLASLTLPIISLVFVVFYDIPHSRNLDAFTISLKVSGIKKILRETFLPFSILVMGLIFANIARYFIDLYHPTLQGYFGIIIMPLSLVILVFSFVLTPALLHLSETYHRSDFRSLHKIIRRIIYAMAAVMLLIVACVYLLGGPLLKLLFTIDFTHYLHDIALIIVIGFLLSVTSLFTNVAIIARKLRLTSLFYLLSNVVLALLCALLVRPYQIRGAIVAYVVVSTLQTVIMGIYYYKLTRVQS